MKLYATDAIKDIMLELRKAQGADIQDTDIITRMESTTGSYYMVGSCWYVSSRPNGPSFILSSATNGLLGSPQLVGGSQIILGDWRLPKQYLASGGFYW